MLKKKPYCQGKELTNLMTLELQKDWIDPIENEICLSNKNKVREDEQILKYSYMSKNWHWLENEKKKTSDCFVFICIWPFFRSEAERNKYVKVDSVFIISVHTEE